MRGTYATALVATLLGGASAFAQTVEPAPVRQSVDANGVDLFLGTLNISRQDASIGAEGGLSYTRIWRNGFWVDNFNIHLFKVDSSTIRVSIGEDAEDFSGTGTYVNAEGGGSTLTRAGQSGYYVYTYTTADGTVYSFSESLRYGYLSPDDMGRVTKIVAPDGRSQVFDYVIITQCTGTGSSQTCTTVRRLNSVTTNSGYRLNYFYDGFTLGRVRSIQLLNLAYEANQSQAVQSAIYNSDTIATNSASRTWNYQITNGKITGIQRPGHLMDVTIEYYTGNGRVKSYRDPAGLTTGYNYSDNYSVNNPELTVTVQVGGNASRYVVFNKITGLVKRDVDELGHETKYEYDTRGRLTKITATDGNSVEYKDFDTRGNIRTRVAHPKPGSRFSDGTLMGDVVSKATFPTTCTYVTTCNKPLTTVDGRGAQTDYTYVSGTGMLEKLMLPAGASGVRPQVRYGFTTDPTSWGAGGSITQVKTITTCLSLSTCDGSAEETVTELDYKNASENLVLQGVRTHSGDNSVSTQTTFGYDTLRNMTRVTDALGYATLYGFSAGREPAWVLSPDPDGPQSPLLKNRMVAVDRYSDGSVMAVKVGTANSNGSGFSELQRTQYGYDAAERKVWEYADVSGARTSQIEYSYDGLGRLDCTNQRMNFNNINSVFGNVAVCDLSQEGSWGPDRITRTEYDAASRITRAWAGYRTATAYHNDYNWTNNNKLERVIDPKNKATTYFYDGFDRLRYTCFTTTSCASAPTLEEQFYDSNGNVLNRRQRDGSSLNYTYDALNRVTVQTAITAANSLDRTTRYSYDNQGRVTKAAVDYASYLDVRYTYDALGRLRKESSDVGMLNVDYDYHANGWLSYIGYGDGYYVSYDYYATGEMFQVRENGATSGSGVLAQIAVDNLGRRKSLVRGDGSREDRAYSLSGNGPWLEQLSQTMGGGGSFTRSFSYNPANQILTRSSNNSAYAWTQAVNVDRSYDVNGLNQYTLSGDILLGYDGRGNLTSAPAPATGSNISPGGSASFGYDTRNMLTSANGSPIYYDAVGRLVMDDNAGPNRKYGYAGSQLLTERKYDGTFVNRYVYGPDEAPLLMYEGSGTGTKRYIVGDERGSVVALTNGQGSVQNINVYDDFGIPGSNNVGRFGYTGQAWNSSMGMWYYKARIYSPTLGRFMQTDPVGYDDGLNMYNYVGGDPVNRTDPSGLFGAPDITVTGERVNDLIQSGLNTTILNLAQNTSQLAANTFASPILSGDLASLTGGARRKQQNGDAQEILVMGSRGAQSRHLNSAELHFYGQFYNADLLAGITLYNGLPPGFSPNKVGAVTLSKNSIYLNPKYYGPSMLGNSYTAGLLGHELFHATAQYANGVTLMDFAASYAACNCYANSRYEAPAFIMESNIVQLYNAGVR